MGSGDDKIGHGPDAEGADDDPDAVAKRIAAQWTSDPEAAGDAHPDEDLPAKAACADGSAAPCKNLPSEPQHDGNDKAGGLLGRVAQSVGSMLGGNKDKAAAAGDPAASRELQDVTQRYKDVSTQAATRQRELDAAAKAIKNARAKLDTVRSCLVHCA